MVRQAWLTAALTMTGYHAPKKFPDSPDAVMGQKSSVSALDSPEAFRRHQAARKKKPKSG